MPGGRLALLSPISAQGRVVLDQLSGVIRGWFDPEPRPLLSGAFAPRELAREVLRQSATLLRWQPSLGDLVDGPVLGVGGGRSVRFTQEFKGVPVLASEIIVNMHADSRVHSLYNQYHYDIPSSLDPAGVTVSALDARELVGRLSSAYVEREIGPARLVVVRYQPPVRETPSRPRRRHRIRERFLDAVRARLARTRRQGAAPRQGDYYLAWQVTLHTRRPLGAWRFLVDAVSGRLLEARDMVSYSAGKGKVFDPNPVVASGDLSLSLATSAEELDALRVPVKLERLWPADAKGRLRLEGAWVQVEDLRKPDFSGPTSKSGHFIFSSASRSFLNVMAYFHIDRFQHYVQHDLKLTGVADFSIPVDPQAENGADNSQATGAEITFGEGVVPDASDAMVIVHEYGHALQHALNPESNFDDFDSGESEGMADFLAAVYFDDKQKAVTPPTRGLMFSWNGNPMDDAAKARHYDQVAPPNTAAWNPGPGYKLAELWSSATFELYRKLGGDSTNPSAKRAARNLAIRLHLMAHAKIPSAHATVTQAAQEIEAADGGLAPWRPVNGLHVKVIDDTFARRLVPGFSPKAVDVFIDDGRHGCYGAADGNDDNFQNVLWLDDHTKTGDIWTRLAPYPSTATPSPTDHEEPQAGQAAFVYVKIGNRGSVGSGPVKARAFAAPARNDLVWKTGWVELAAPATQPSNVSPGGSAIAGPFPWTPAKSGNAPMLVILECASDKAVTELLDPGAAVPIIDLVPFDNNIAMRDIHVAS
jgi:hypothetical protein